MNLKQVTKLYEAMDTEKRAALASNALARGDIDTYLQIAQTVPRLEYKKQDIRFSQGVSDRCDLMLAWSCEHWRTLALYLTNQKLAIEALNKGNMEEHEELQELVTDSMSKLVALEAVFKVLASDANLDVSKMFDSELLVTFGDKASLDSLTEKESRYFEELYTAFAPTSFADLRPIDD